MKPVYIIAEIGQNHNGDIDQAIRLIDLAAVAGCNAVKFQKRTPSVCIPEHQKSVIRDTIWGRMDYLSYREKLEFGQKEFDIISEYCKSKKIDWSASVWDIPSVDFMNQYTDSIPWLKIPSAKITDLELVEKVVIWASQSGKKIIISTGMSTEEEINACVKKIYDDLHPENLIILHCNSAYPCDIKDMNLSYIGVLKKRYPGSQIGWSGHEVRVGTSVSSAYLGAEVIERHITLNRFSPGTDHLSSLEPPGLIKLVSGIRELEQAYGEPVKSISSAEMECRKKLRG